MNHLTPKIISISDIIQWNNKKELQLSPKYQRNSVWNEKAKSYLLDTIIRGLPIPPIFLRQEIDILTKSTSREIIDGQQRIRAILEFVVDEKFAISKSHNKENGGKKYSDLSDNIKENILNYEILAEVVSEKDESIIYDMFARLNSNNYVLNKQEIRNSVYWGEFKVLVYNLSSEYRDFFLQYQLLSDNECTRMKDAELVTSMIILLIDGIVSETPTFVDNIYKKFDTSFDNSTEIETKLNCVMNAIKTIYEYYSGNLGCLANKNYFFTLFAVLVNQMYGIDGISLKRQQHFSANTIESNIDELINACGNFLKDYDVFKIVGLLKGPPNEKNWSTFMKNHRARTTSKNERTNRISFLNMYFSGENNATR